MNALVSRIVFVGLIFSHSYQLMAHVALDYPQGGETFIVGESVTIEWHILVPHNTLNWDLYFSANAGVTWDTIQLDIPLSQLSYGWEVPDIITTQGRIRVIQDNVDQDYLDISMDFTIAPNTSPPVLDAPATDTMIECSVAGQDVAIQAWLNNHGGAAVTNYCGELVWTNDFPGLSNGCGATGNAEVTFTATDVCGFTSTTATLMVIDTQSPAMIVYPLDLVVQSDGQGNIADLNTWLDNKGGAQASDECSTVIWTNNYTTLTGGCGSTGSATVIFTVRDACENSISTTAVFTIEDHIAPAIQIPAHDTTIACNASNQQIYIQAWLDDHGGAQAYDVGGDVIWTHNYSGLSDGCGSTGDATVVFTATDECGNNISTSATLLIEDHVIPTIIIPARDTTFICGTQDVSAAIENWLNNHGGASVSDLCGSVHWTNNFPALTDTCGPVGSHNVFFTATDECGNATTIQAILTIQDSLPTSVSNTELYGFKIYPNPASDLVNVVFDKKEFGIIQISLFDSFGKPVWSATSEATETSVPVNSIPSGLYFLQVRTSKGIYLRKVMIH